VQKSDFFGGSDPTKNVFEALEKEYEPTLIVMPDLISKVDDYYDTCVQVLMHCQKTQSRFGLFDVNQTDLARADVEKFRTAIGTTALNYGAAYYPWLRTSVVQANEIDFNNLADSVKLADLLPENKDKITEVLAKKDQMMKEHKAKEATASADELAADLNSINTNIHQSLSALSPTYRQVMEEIRSRLNLLPPSSAMAGIYTLIDSTRGVWKAPANVSIAQVNAPAVNISHDQQEQMNVDVIAGKSINVIRPFPGIGTLVWGARTLDGNSQDWRYINVRRTMIMIEQSLKLATRAYVFEPNDSGTWVTLQSMMNNFLFNLWKLGCLAGSAPEQAYDVQVGLGKTMTPNDILDGILRVSVKVAVVRPAEFIVITFQQMQQQA
ncbi:MAG TPA: phage tail sheath C-terminal domain-containing protein, partial [Ferruginibacter sp.]|nr:phage tail sheath C-terminal domain-containing protein [Ferruginibacter sp.]